MANDAVASALYDGHRRRLAQTEDQRDDDIAAALTIASALLAIAAAQRDVSDALHRIADAAERDVLS